MANDAIANLTSLLQNTTIEDHDEYLKASNAVLKTSKLDTKALHTRVVALLKLDRFDDALRALSDGGDKLAQECVLERAYALYKTGKLEDAERVCREGGNHGRGLQHVAAQTAYRAERFEDAGKIYEGLMRGRAEIEGEEMDLRINGLAVNAQLSWQGRSKGEEIKNEDMEAFETAYNAACGCIAREDYKKGAILLKRARDLCEALEELSDEEKRAEVLPIMVQQVFVLTKLGKVEEAEGLRKMIDIADVPEAPTKTIAQNNSLAISKDIDNPYEVQRIFASAPKLSHGEKHFEHQANILEQNRYAIDLQTKKYDGVAKSTLKIISKTVSPTISPWINSLSVLNAAAHTRCEVGKAGLKEILPVLEKRPNDVGLLLTTIQLYVLTNNPSQAIALLETFFRRLEESDKSEDQDVRYAPGLIALLISLYRLSGRKPHIRSELGKAASYWRQKSAPSASLLHAAGVSLLESSSPEDSAAAGEIFSSLRSQDPTDRVAIAGCVASYASSDFSKIENDLDKLTPIAQLIAGINAEELENAGIPSLPSAAQPAASKKRALDAEKEVEEANKKKKTAGTRKSKLPKDFVEGKKMDPERWLPLRDRSTYKPKGKKGKKKAMDTTQGGVVREDALEGVEAKVSSGVVGGGGGGNKGKKKKGKR
ncbi:signal recognition particle protein [Rutstroemia sp. NJR-2017a WRK4]|nr:signal recognition particle protein [Rutstroemia sp. NJR-2017a WRK4]